MLCFIAKPPKAQKRMLDEIAQEFNLGVGSSSICATSSSANQNVGRSNARVETIHSSDEGDDQDEDEEVDLSS